MDHLTLEQCCELKKLGFPQNTHYWYGIGLATFQSMSYDGTLELICNEMNEGYNHNAIACPTLGELIEWLGDEFNTMRNNHGDLRGNYEAHAYERELSGYGKTTFPILDV